MKPVLLAATAVACLIPAVSHAGETLTFSYDAKGRLVRVVHSGTINGGVQTTYSHDKADNRKNTTTTGSGNPPPP
jgi:YD repeat-containing protein